MKKFIVFILAVTYFGLSTGATVHMHYCMGKLVGSSLWHNDKSDRCSKCGMEKNSSKNKCCKDEHKLVKIEKDQTVSQTVYQFTPVDFAIEKNNLFELSPVSFTETTKDNTCINAPPRSLKVAIYISNCIFRI
ncbi:MAG TPA: hypothetical protein VHP12_10205 [Chitinophagaceae bacterium]|nr:hypothetical protein [Chitinophagaceae bacterium]